jgi:large subunit ribosomal protein L6
MSRIGKKPIPILKGVEVTSNARSLSVKGPKGELTLEVHPDVKVTVDGR